ncbi:FAD binding domain-containing protein [Penicillium lividum]|nr:FAD binding domain-containing protein [Penicillium lividum]
MGTQTETTDGVTQALPSGTVLIAGGGPIGLLLARILSFYGVKSALFERNLSTTKWPKMDLTNARSMEIFRKIGLADSLRKHGVPADIDQNVLISTGLSATQVLTRWELPSVDKFWQRILQTNDGTQPQEPWQRVSQAIFERWLKAICDEDPMIDLNYGFKVESVEEYNDIVKTTVTNVATGTQTVWSSDYVAGCDGASSRVRTSLSIPIDGGPIPSCALLVHFKSHDLTRLHKQGRFWHIFLLGASGEFEAAIISQDEKDTWTTHLFLPLDAEPEKIDSYDAVYRVLGGLYGPYRIEIDEILVRSIWRPNIAVARSWMGSNGRVFLAGDSAHQNIPTGGYGMNMGIGDAFDLSWKLASVINCQGGIGLLKSYELERRPVALRNVEHSGVHFQVHSGLKDLLSGGDPRRVDGDDEDALALRKQIHEYYQLHDGENKDFGIEMGYRYNSPIVIRRDDDGVEPDFSPHKYIPTTWPGSRAPHLYLTNRVSIFDMFGKDWTLLVFTNQEVGKIHLVTAARSLGLSLRQVDLSEEKDAKRLYERNLVLIRPDHHVAWRAMEIESLKAARNVIEVITGRLDSSPEPSVNQASEAANPKNVFTSTTGIATQMNSFTLERMAEFQQ